MNEYDCIDMKCSHYDGDMCTRGTCDPDSEIYSEYLKWEKETSYKFEQSVTFREWFDSYTPVLT